MKRLLNVEATTYCPASCAMCPRDEIKENGCMTLKMAEIINKKIKEFGDIWEISVAGRGEPTIHPQFCELVKILHREIPVSVVTTGAHVDENVLYAFENYVDKIRISVSSKNKKIFESVHIGLEYEKVWGNIEKIIEKCGAEKVIIHLVGGEIIYPGVEETVSYLRKRGIENIYIFPLWNRAGSKEQNSEAIRRQHLINKYGLLPSESEYIEKNVDEGIKCKVGNASVSVNFRGDVSSCFQDFGYKSQIGNIESDSTPQILKKKEKVVGNMEMCKLCNSLGELVDV